MVIFKFVMIKRRGSDVLVVSIVLDDEVVRVC